MMTPRGQNEQPGMFRRGGQGVNRDLSKCGTLGEIKLKDAQRRLEKHKVKKARKS